MMAEQESDALGETGEGPSVSRQDEIDLKIGHLAQAVHELGQGVDGGKPRGDSRRDALQHMIPRDEEARPGLVEADVPSVVPRGLDDPKGVGARFDGVSLGQVGERGIGFQGQQLGGDVEPRALVGESHLPLLLEGGRLEKQRAVDRLLQGQEVLHFLEGMEMGLHRHTGTPDAVEIARMVGMGVGEHDAHAVPGAAEGHEGVIESSLAVGVVEAHVHDDGLSPASQYEVGVDSLERIGRQGHFH